MGILLYAMVFGDIPFKTDDQIEHAHLNFPPDIQLSDNVSSCIKGCLTVSETERITLAQLQNHPWLKEKHFEQINDLNGSS